MREKYLSLEQNICAARIFLNTFGLTLENVSDVNEFSKIKIFDKDMNGVGELHFNSGKVIMLATYNDSVLDASFDMAKMWGFADKESRNALFGQWSSKVAFQLQKTNDVKLFGEFLIESSADTELGVSCICHPLINCDVAGKEYITLKILRNGSMFGFEVIAKEGYEKIDVRPWDWSNGFLLHDIKKGKYDEEKHAYPYRRYAGVFNCAEIGEDKDKLHIFLNEEEYHNQISCRNEFPLKVGEDKSEALVIQKGMLMRELDPDMFEKIKKLREILFIGDVSLLDNLVSVCYDSYTDEELSALLGVNRQRMNYQNGADSLVNSYYGVNISNCFFPLETQKRLRKK